MTAARRYYPGFFAALFLVLLRTAIGWHFLYEGVEKIYTTPEGRDSFLTRVLPRHTNPDPPFSAEGYLRNATGPLAPYFREMVPDVDGLDRLNAESLKGRWRDELGRYAAHYNFDAEKRTQAEAALETQAKIAEAWFLDVENADKVRKYKDDLRRIDATLSNPRSLSFERERAYDERRQLESDRRSLVGVADGWTKSLRDSWRQLGGKDEKVAPPPTLRSKIDWINIATMGGLVAVGACLMLGLFTRLAALGAVGYLAMFYLSMPPWPHVPSGPMVEGHYLFVNKNLIELIACLVLASTPTGLWIGLDALLFGGAARRKAARAAAAEAAAQGHPAATPDGAAGRVVVANPARKSKAR